jgi:ketosteroid isomerase-like protein
VPAANADVVRANSEAFSRRDVGAMLELFAPDAVVGDRRAVGWGDFHGRDAIRAYYEGLFDNADRIYEDLVVVAEQGDVVVASCRASAHLAGQAEADVVTFEYALKVTVADGSITALEIYEDAAAAGAV